MTEKFLKFREPDGDDYSDSDIVINKDEILSILISVQKNGPPYTTEVTESKELLIYLIGDKDGEPSFTYQGEFAERLYRALLSAVGCTQILPDELS